MQDNKLQLKILESCIHNEETLENYKNIKNILEKTQNINNLTIQLHLETSDFKHKGSNEKMVFNKELLYVFIQKQIGTLTNNLKNDYKILEDLNLSAKKENCQTLHKPIF